MWFPPAAVSKARIMSLAMSHHIPEQQSITCGQIIEQKQYTDESANSDKQYENPGHMFSEAFY